MPRTKPNQTLDTKEFIDRHGKTIVKTKISLTELNEIIQEMIQDEFLKNQRAQNKFALNRPGRSIEKEQPIMWVNHPDKYRQYKRDLLDNKYYIG